MLLTPIQPRETMNFRKPPEGAKALPLLLDFTQAPSITVEFQQLQAFQNFSMIQTIYVDMSSSDSALVMTIDPSALMQTIVVNGRTEGYFNVLSPNPSVLKFDSAANAVLKVILINSPIPGAVWAATHP